MESDELAATVERLKKYAALGIGRLTEFAGSPGLHA
jgi:hypothetical protein